MNMKRFFTSVAVASLLCVAPQVPAEAVEHPPLVAAPATQFSSIGAGLGDIVEPYGGRKTPDIPRRLLVKNHKDKNTDYVDLSLFTKTVKVGTGRNRETRLQEKKRWTISKDRGNNPHGGSVWKLFDSRNRRVATLAEDGKVLRG